MDARARLLGHSPDAHCLSARRVGDECDSRRGGNVIVVALFAISWWLRRSAPGEPSETAITLSIVGVLIALVTGWLV